MSRRKRQNGFTLVEIILAIMILAIMTLMSFFCFHSVVQSWRIGMEVTDAMGQADYVMDQVVSALKSAYYPDTGQQMDAYGLQFYNNGDGPEAKDSLSWVKIGNALVGEECGFAESPHRVQLYVADGTGRNNEGEGLTVMAWRVDLHLDDFEPEKDVEPLLLAPRIMGMDCRVIDKDQPRKNDEPNWEDEWKFSNSIPRAVEVTLYMRPVEKNGEPLEVKRVVEIPMSDLSLNPRQPQNPRNTPVPGGGAPIKK
ncbi:MAG: prepilin-type N-terminal cleavage/methylation domain-containing protein [Kiritimatiellaeota bacterium]|nr:prepilin-type N-terminal cleavage/methylation domain-containing protein [Kiritimatiellota bacterium]